MTPSCLHARATVLIGAYMLRVWGRRHHPGLFASGPLPHAATAVSARIGETIPKQCKLDWKGGWICMSDEMQKEEIKGANDDGAREKLPACHTCTGSLVVVISVVQWPPRRRVSIRARDIMGASRVMRRCSRPLSSLVTFHIGLLLLIAACLLTWLFIDDKLNCIVHALMNIDYRYKTSTSSAQSLFYNFYFN